ncbi:SigE family RNA polymerase sigma factor [Actinoplanes sp. URMC 104]|uniref:SigE family RNA polymerase sigma factor n=1 Tax=Actinoplanes sp. URMC 104 TaxID=3423409 RepID=UPI003F1D5028
MRAPAYVTCGDWQAAEDAVAGALARLYLRWNRVTSPDAYARTMVVRAAIGEKRRPWRRERSAGDALPDVPRPDESGQVDERLRLRAALSQVPPRQRAVLVLRFLEGLSVEETAEVLGCRTGTVKSQTARGLNALRAVPSVTELLPGADTTTPLLTLPQGWSTVLGEYRAGKYRIGPVGQVTASSRSCPSIATARPGGGRTAATIRSATASSLSTGPACTTRRGSAPRSRAPRGARRSA